MIPKQKESYMKKKFYLSKHKNGYYYIYYTDECDKRQSISTRTKYKTEALSVLNELTPELLSNRKTSDKTLKEFRWEFLKASESYHSWKTTLDYRSTFNELERHFGNILLSDITRNGVEEFIQKKIKAHSLHTGRRHLINIKALLSKAVALDYIQNNPSASIKRIKIPEKLPSFFTKKEFHNLINNIDDIDYKDVIEFAVNTGLRQMEILTLTRQQLNIDKKIIILDNHNHTTKSKKVRAIPLNKKALEILLKRRGDLLFSKNGKAISSDHLQDRFRKYVKKSGITRKITFHSLRHTFASWLVQAGVSIYDVSKLLGHSDIKTTQIYAHLRPDDLKRAVDLL